MLNKAELRYPSPRASCINLQTFFIRLLHFRLMKSFAYTHERISLTFVYSRTNVEAPHNDLVGDKLIIADLQKSRLTRSVFLCLQFCYSIALLILKIVVGLISLNQSILGYDVTKSTATDLCSTVPRNSVFQACMTFLQACMLEGKIECNHD